MESTLMTDRRACFQFKANFSPCTILQMSRYDLDELSQQLADTIKRAPHFFQGSPLVVDLEAVKTMGTLDFARIKQIFLDHQLVPVGVRGGSPEQHAEAVRAGIPIIAIGKSTTSTANRSKKSAVPFSASKLITSPVRSGMQIYAKNADLIVMASVSPGAELLADGHIHVYGTLRGRALAGVQGNTQARIFCRVLEAELVAIAGYYLLKEEIQCSSVEATPMQIYLANEHIKIAAM